MGLCGLRWRTTAMAEGQINKEGRQTETEHMHCLILRLRDPWGEATAQAHTPNSYFYLWILLSKKIRGCPIPTLCAIGRPGQCGPRCEKMFMRVRIQGEALQPLLRYCFGLASPRTADSLQGSIW